MVPHSDAGTTRAVSALRLAAAAGALLAAGCEPQGPIELPEPIQADAVIEYPVELWDAGVEGETILMVHVTETGSVDSAYVDRSSGLPEFDSAAIRGSRSMRFSPGTQGGERRAMWTRLPVRFRKTDPNSSMTTPAGSRE